MTIPAQSLEARTLRRELVRVGGAEMAVFEAPGDWRRARRCWSGRDGWGQNHEPLLPLAEAVRRSARSIPARPPGLRRRAAAARRLEHHGLRGGGGRMAKEAWRRGRASGWRIPSAAASGCNWRRATPISFTALFLIAAPGLPRHRSPAEQARFLVRRWAFRLWRGRSPGGAARDRLRERFGSAITGRPAHCCGRPWSRRSTKT